MTSDGSKLYVKGRGFNANWKRNIFKTISWAQCQIQRLGAESVLISIPQWERMGSH
jgi:hypothetical protein